MTTRKKMLLVLVILVLAMSLTACSRGRFRQGLRSPVTPVPADAKVHSDGLSSEAEELDDLMNEMDQILRDTDTSVVVP